MASCADWPDELLLEGRPADFVAHAATCVSCAARGEDLAALAALRGPERLEPAPRTDAAVLEVIRAEAARRAAGARRPTTRRRIHRYPMRRLDGARLLISLAAVALFATFIGLALSRTEPRAPRARELPRTVKAPPPSPAPEPEPPLPPIERPKDLPLPPTPAPPDKDPGKPSPPLPPAPVPEPKAPPPPRTTIVEAPAPPAREFARVVRVSGSADVKKGDLVRSGQTVACRMGVVSLEMADDSQIALRAGASLSADVDAEGVVIRLHDGEVACSVRQRPERRFAVETPHGAAVVRGTMFSVKTQASGAAVVVARGRVELRNADGVQEVAAGERSRLAKGAAPSKPEAAAAERLLEWAGLRVAGPIWLAAGGAELRAPMSRGRLEGSLSPETLFGAVDARTLKSWSGRFLKADGDEGGTAAWVVDIPEDGVWQLWGRFYHPASGQQVFRQAAEPFDNDPNSFFVSVDDGPERVFGNHKEYRRWHWAGDGAAEVGPTAPLKLKLAKGRHVFRVRPRDAVETASLRLAPRLDVLCLSPDADYRPRDEDYRKP